MSSFIIEGGHKLCGDIYPQGAKNEVLQIICATLLTKENFKRYEKMVTASLFKELFEKAPESLRERLTVQFRMHPQIMKMKL